MSKSCPNCRLVNPDEVAQCDCGYAFGPQVTLGAGSTGTADGVADCRFLLGCRDRGRPLAPGVNRDSPGREYFRLQVVGVRRPASGQALADVTCAFCGETLRLLVNSRRRVWRALATTLLAPVVLAAVAIAGFRDALFEDGKGVLPGLAVMAAVLALASLGRALAALVDVRGIRLDCILGRGFTIEVQGSHAVFRAGGGQPQVSPAPRAPGTRRTTAGATASATRPVDLIPGSDGRFWEQVREPSRLAELLRAWDHDEGLARLDLLKAAARHIGEDLQARGGMELMLRAHREARGGREIEIAWNGIGEWRG